MGDTGRRALARAGTPPSGRAGGSGDKDFAPCGDAEAGGAGGGSARIKKSKHWCGRGVTEEEEVLASQNQRLALE
jgi:hypothetical protein